MSFGIEVKKPTKSVSKLNKRGGISGHNKKGKWKMCQNLIKGE